MLEMNWRCFCAECFFFFKSYVFLEIRASTVDHSSPSPLRTSSQARSRARYAHVQKETSEVAVNA